MPIPTERRKYQRVVMTRPLPGRLGGARVYVLDASLIGVRIAHQGTAPPAGSPCLIEFEWEGRLIELECEVRRNDEVAVTDADGYDGVLLSPGPGTPENAGVCVDMVRHVASRAWVTSGPRT